MQAFLSAKRTLLSPAPAARMLARTAPTAVIAAWACMATAVAAPPAPTDAQGAELHRDRYGTQNTLYLQLPPGTAANAPTDRIVAQLSSQGEDGLSVSLSGQRLPDGRLQYIVFLHPAWESRYYLQIVDWGPANPLRLYEGSFQGIPERPQR